jgi:glutamate racemase
MKENQPIGIFDSGVGGLTLLKGIKSILPNESLIYLGDTARVPYGTKSPKVVRKFSLQIAHFLENFGIKALVVACHTASSTALSELKTEMGMPVVGVIEPAVKRAINSTKNKNVGIIGTKTTIESKSYQSLIQKLAPKVSVIAVSAPLLVPLVEEGWLAKDATRIILREYVSPLKKGGSDTLVLGCTHYPLLKNLFMEELGETVTLIDTSSETALHLKDILKKSSLLNNNTKSPHYSFYVSDDPDKFSKLAQLFLGEKIATVKLANLEET